MIPHTMCTDIIRTLKNIYEERSVRGFLINLYGSAYNGKHPLNAVLAVHLCAKTTLPTYVVSYEGQIPDDKLDFLKRHSVQRINTSLSGAYWKDMICEINYHNLYAVGVLDKCELEWIRNYDHFTEIADIQIFANLKKSFIEEMYKSRIDLSHKYEADVWENRPSKVDKIRKHGSWSSGDFGITYEELEWADENNNRTHILDGEDPTKNSQWFHYTTQQKRVLSRIYEIEKSTRYKRIYYGEKI